MTSIQRLKQAEIQNGQVINAADISAELDQLVSQSNTHDSQIGQLGQSVYTFAGLKTFNDGLKTNTIAEQTTASGTAINGVTLKGGAVQLATTTPPTTEGSVWYHPTHQSLQAYAQGRPRLLLPASATYLAGPAPFWVSASQIRLPQGLVAVDDTGVKLLEITPTGGVTLDITQTGALGRDGGIETVSTWYYVWLCAGTSGITAVLSASRSAPSLPTGYTDYKRLLPLAIRNDANSHFIPFSLNNWGAAGLTQVLYNVGSSYYNGSAYVLGETNVLNSGVATSWTDVALSAFVPPNATVASLCFLHNGVGYFNWRAKGQTHTGMPQIGTISTGPSTGDMTLATDSTQTVQYIRQSGAGGALYADVRGFTITQG